MITPKLTLSIALLAMAVTASLAQAADQTRWFVFGDSLSDDGSSAMADSNPHSWQASGRASNGLLWHEHLRDGLMTAPDLERIAKAPKLGSGYNGNLNLGINFAHGGATIDEGETSAYQQMEAYARWVQAGQIQAPDTNDLFIIWIGGNDFLERLEEGQTPKPQRMIAGLNDGIRALLDEGAQRFMLIGLPYFGGGFLGAQVAETNKSFVDRVNKRVREFNKSLEQRALGLRQDGNEALYVDIYALMQSVENAPSTYGFDHVQLDCGAISTPCDDGVFSFDGIHPTTAGHNVIADYVRSAAVKTGFDLGLAAK